MATRSANQTTVLACRHLGLANDPFQHADDITKDHRCYLWMQRDLIDQDHQRNYCLSGHHADCPWLQISVPCRSKRDSRPAGEGRGHTFGDAGRRAGITIIGLLVQVTAKLGPVLRSLAEWMWTNTPKAAARVWRTLAPAVGTAARGTRKAAVQSGKALSESRHKRRLKTAAAVEGRDFSMLMRLGREANRAGRREEAFHCFSRAAALDATSEDVWLWVAATTDDPAEAEASLEKALAINPTGKGRVQLVGLSKPAAPIEQEETEVLGHGLSASMLLEQGLKAMDQGNEDRAHSFFVAAIEENSSNETAWFWRAKTSTDLAEVITCLKRVLVLNPGNEKAQDSLTWALDRQKADREREKLAYTRPQGPVFTTSFAQPNPPRPPSILQVSSLAYMVLGLLWSAPLALLLLDQGLASTYHKIALLPVLNMPYQSTSILGLHDLIPEFNLFYAAPAGLAVLCFVAMETIWSPRRTTSAFAALVTGASVYGTMLFVTHQSPAFWTLVALSCLAGLGGLAGRLIYRRRSRRQNSRAERQSSGASYLSETGRSTAAHI